jgi:hypothetical protein
MGDVIRYAVENERDQRVSATAPLPVRLYGDDGVEAGVGYFGEDTLTRANDTVAYGAVDVIGESTTAGSAVMTFAGVGPDGGGDVLFTDAELEISLSAVPSGMTTFTLHLFSVTPPSALADAATFDVPSGDRASYLGSINLGSPVDLGSTLYVQTSGINLKRRLASSSVFGYLVTTGAYSGAAETAYKVKLHAIGV